VRRLSLLPILCMAMLVSRAVSAHDAEFIVDNLARTYQGSFQWEDSSQVQKVSIVFDYPIMLAPSLVSVPGRGTYDLDGRSTFKIVKCLIDVRTLQIEIWERDPATDAAAFGINGSHVGSISANLKSISATWTNISNGERGTLRLSAK
jgi:hypothetical protein